MYAAEKRSSSTSSSHTGNPHFLPVPSTTLVACYFRATGLFSGQPAHPPPPAGSYYWTGLDGFRLACEILFLIVTAFLMLWVWRKAYHNRGSWRSHFWKFWTIYDWILAGPPWQLLGHPPQILTTSCFLGFQEPTPGVASH